MPNLRKVLIANRGEIAVRVIRTCRELGIDTVAIYSEADEGALHVRMADEAICVGPAPSAQSYLVQENVIQAAIATGADAVHPGYGFLSENASFAEACNARGLNFIGPPAAAIRSMGDKTSARKLMAKAGVPMAPGTVDAVSDAGEAAAIASDIGFPVLIKAAAGGGGKGMRVVETPSGLTTAIRQAQSEALASFGDGRVYVEKYLLSPRHIEFQVLADQHGNVVHFFERECSIQRRHQKVVEEAPSAVLTSDLRAAMGEAAVQATRACGYVGAGTIEFLLDENLDFYFLEMNTRLQVEHPVTEMVTGFDLVAEQIRIASGEPLGYVQSDLSLNGHAIECRIYAEDVNAGFLPAPGRLLRHIPASGPGVRCDAGVEEGDTIPIHYDPMISKLSTWGASRDQAIRRMRRALIEYDIAGVETTIPFCAFVMNHPAFTAGAFDTGFVNQHFEPHVMSGAKGENKVAFALGATTNRTSGDQGSATHERISDEPEPARRCGWTARRRPAIN